MKRSEAFFGILRLPMDTLGVCAALLLSYRLREANVDLIPGVQLLDPSPTLPLMEVYISQFVYPGIVLFIAIAAALGLYALRTTGSGWLEVGKILLASLLWVVFVMAWYFLVIKQLFYSRVLLVHSVFFLTLFVLMSRTAVLLLQRASMRWGVGVRLVASIGEHPISRNARKTLAGDMRYKYLGHTENLAGLKQLSAKTYIDLVIQTDPNPASTQTMSLIDYCRSHHIGYAFLPPVFADVPHQLQVSKLGLVPMLQFKPTPLDGWGRIFKRFTDIVFSAALLVLLSPLLIAITLLVLLTMGWPVIYVSWRVGELGRAKVPVLKFRSMVRDADARKKDLIKNNERRDGPLFKMRDDPRVTPLGRVLRRFDLDELPQLFNVLAGHMSLVGPRPHLPDEVSRYSSYERRVFAVKPGITGFAQISGRSDLRFKEEVQLDLQYVEEWSPLLDLWILWRTVFVVLKKSRTY